MKRAIITVGLGFGDEGKGATVDHLCRTLNAGLVVRYSGGSQCGHNVYHEGKRHTFSQFGAGTFAGAETYLGPQVVVYPEALMNEADHLLKMGVSRPLDLISMHDDCLITTKYHRAANRLRELARGENRHGSCGHGIGEARRYWLNYGKDAIFASDLDNFHRLAAKMELMRQRFLMELQPVLDDMARVFSKDDLLDSTAVRVKREEFEVFGKLVNEVALGLYDCGKEFMVGPDSPMQHHDTVIFEGAQGVLLDEYHGFHPHTTWSTVTMRHAEEMLFQYPGCEVTRMGVIRAYHSRHGAGPLPTEDARLTEVVSDKGNPFNKWQENFRAGWLDLELLRHAADAVGKLDCLAVNCVDHLSNVGGDIKIGLGWGAPLLQHANRLSRSEANGEGLRNAKPALVPTNVAHILEVLGEVAPVVVLSQGPAHKDRKTLPAWDRIIGTR